MIMFNKDHSSLLRDYISLHSLTQEMAAVDFGVTSRTIRNWLSGYEMPKLAVEKCLAGLRQSLSSNTVIEEQREDSD